jgi:hypothetical protein
MKKPARAPSVSDESDDVEVVALNANKEAKLKRPKQFEQQYDDE